MRNVEERSVEQSFRMLGRRNPFGGSEFDEMHRRADSSLFLNIDDDDSVYGYGR